MISISENRILIKDIYGNPKFDTSLNMPKLVSTYSYDFNVPNIQVVMQLTLVINGSPVGFSAISGNNSISLPRPNLPNVSSSNRFAIVFFKSSNSALGHPLEYTMCNGSTILDIINTAAMSAQARKDATGVHGARVIHTNISANYVDIKIETKFNFYFGNTMFYGINGINQFPPSNMGNSSFTSSYSRYYNGMYGISLGLGNNYNNSPYWEFLNSNTTLTFVVKEYAW